MGSSIFAFGDPDISKWFFFLLCGIGIALAIIVYMVAAFPQYRREQYSDGPPRPGCGIFFGVLILIFFFYYAYDTTYARFFQMEVYGDRLEFQYRFPERTEEVFRDDIVRVYILRQKTTRSLVVVDNFGEKFRSAPCGGKCREYQDYLKERGVP